MTESIRKRVKPNITEQSILQYGKIPPQCVDIEETVLGCIIGIKDSFLKVIDYIKLPEMFYKEAHQKIFNACKLLFNECKPIDRLTVVNKLKELGELDIVGGPYYLVQISKDVFSDANIAFHCQVIREKYIGREVIRMATEAVTNAYEDTHDKFEVIDSLQMELFNLTDFDNIKILSMRENVSEFTDLVANFSGKEITGIPTGLACMDSHLKGLQRSDLTIIAAETSQGKTALTLSMVANVIESGVPVLFASYEMSNVQLTGRVICINSGVSRNTIFNNTFTDSERFRYNKAIDEISQSPMYLYDMKNNSIGSLMATIRKHKILFDIQLVAVDYLQLVSGDKGKNRNMEIGEISRQLKNIAKELNIHVILLSQLSRSEKHYPTMKRLRDSGEIEESADNIIFVYRQEEYIGEGYSDTYSDGVKCEGVAKIIHAKGRNVGTTDYYLSFHKETTKFSNYRPNSEQTYF